MSKTINPDGIAPPWGHYSHGVEIPSSHRQLHLAGQVGVLPEGGMASGARAQAEQAWSNIAAVLAADGMDLGDIVSYTTYVVNPEDLGAVREVRDAVLGAARPASTLVVVRALARPEWLVEIAVVAARH